MSDQEIICAFMEPQPPFTNVPDTRWWRCLWDGTTGWKWYPVCHTLDALWEVEERLRSNLTLATDYLNAVLRVVMSDGQTGSYWGALHATPEQKIKALAAVLRPLVEAK